MQDLKNLNCLLPKTETLLLKMVAECSFLEKYVLVGGSALALYLCHRKSEDLDFFTYSDSFDRKEIFEHSQNIVEGMNFKLFAIALVYIDDIEDDNIEYLEPIEKISKEEIREFFQYRLDRIVMR